MYSKLASCGWAFNSSNSKSASQIRSAIRLIPVEWLIDSRNLLFSTCQLCIFQGFWWFLFSMFNTFFSRKFSVTCQYTFTYIKIYLGKQLEFNFHNFFSKKIMKNFEIVSCQSYLFSFRKLQSLLKKFKLTFFREMFKISHSPGKKKKESSNLAWKNLQCQFKKKWILENLLENILTTSKITINEQFVCIQQVHSIFCSIYKSLCAYELKF
jgi:hypothetical protein